MWFTLGYRITAGYGKESDGMTAHDALRQMILDRALRAVQMLSNGDARTAAHEAELWEQIREALAWK